MTIESSRRDLIGKLDALIANTLRMSSRAEAFEALDRGELHGTAAEVELKGLLYLLGGREGLGDEAVKATKQALDVVCPTLAWTWRCPACGTPDGVSTKGTVQAIAIGKRGDVVCQAPGAGGKVCGHSYAVQAPAGSRPRIVVPNRATRRAIRSARRM